MSALVFDFGLKHIGVAVALRDQRFAHGIATLAAHSGDPHLPSLDALLEEWRPSELIVGDPLNMDGTTSCMAKRARRFGDSIAKRYGLPVTYVDERLSTFEASSWGAQGRDVHAAAAAAIAATWLREP